MGSVRDVVVKSEKGYGNGGMIEMRVFTPVGEAPTGGWPVLVWLHGGECLFIFFILIYSVLVLVLIEHAQAMRRLKS